MIPTIPLNPSVSLSARDRSFVKRRRQSALAVRRTKLQTALGAFCVAIWVFSLSAMVGGAA